MVQSLKKKKKKKKRKKKKKKKKKKKDNLYATPYFILKKINETFFPINYI